MNEPFDEPARVAASPVALNFVAAGLLASFGVLVGTALVTFAGDPGWRSGLLVGGDGLWLVPTSLIFTSAVTVCYRSMFTDAALTRRNGLWIAVQGHPVSTVRYAAPFCAPAVVLFVGRGRLLESAEALVLLLLALTAALEFFRRRSRIAVEGERATPVDDGLRFYGAGAITVGMATLFVLANQVVYFGRLDAGAAAFACALGLSLAIAFGYIGLLAVWVPSTPIADLPLRLLTLTTWALLATPAFVSPGGLRPLGLSAICCALFVGVNEPIRRRAAQRLEAGPR